MHWQIDNRHMARTSDMIGTGDRAVTSDTVTNGATGLDVTFACHE